MQMVLSQGLNVPKTLAPTLVILNESTNTPRGSMIKRVKDSVIK